MKSTELRIGNVFVQKGCDFIEYVTLETFELLSRNAIIIKPVPLNEKWLLRFGAVHQPWGWVLFGFLIRWSLNPKLKYWLEVGNGKRIYFPYVHILQNFFALTQKELEIK